MRSHRRVFSSMIMYNDNNYFIIIHCNKYFFFFLNLFFNCVKMIIFAVAAFMTVGFLCYFVCEKKTINYKHTMVINVGQYDNFRTTWHRNRKDSNNFKTIKWPIIIFFFSHVIIIYRFLRAGNRNQHCDRKILR